MSEKRTFPQPPSPKNNRSQRAEQIGAGVGAGMRIIGAMAILLMILFWCSGITMVQPNEVALVTRFGKLVGSTPSDQVKQPGMLLAWPYPIDEVIRIPVKEEREVAIGRLQLSEASNQTSVLDPIRDGYVLCGDQHILQTSVRVKYRIADPVAYHFQADRPERVLEEAATASVVQTVASWNAMDTLRLQRTSDNEVVERLPLVVRQTLQDRLDLLGLGIEVNAVEFREITPTPQLAQAFENVQSEQIHIETRKREAEGFVARTIPQAEAQRYTLVNEATRFQTEITTNADQEVTLFDKVYAQYLANPELVWSRLYLEAMEQIMQNVGQLKFVAPGTRIVISPGNTTNTDIPPGSQSTKGQEQ
ncbi:protease modulator HflK [Bremerella alba]|uniref:Modulator of FtsH protease HflK n=1 Tax=Bremerella alba TaxID=980252 RepID=A0A7V8V5Z5_9BACT|nr:protease modulator HflK [Bremerella alba]MBA2115329.1 Modulator of FtsH protease HflK [Bremerella alba]